MNYQPTNSFSSPVHRTLPAWTRSWKFCVSRQSCFTRISPQWLIALTQALKTMHKNPDIFLSSWQQHPSPSDPQHIYTRPRIFLSLLIREGNATQLCNEEMPSHIFTQIGDLCQTSQLPAKNGKCPALHPKQDGEEPDCQLLSHSQEEKHCWIGEAQYIGTSSMVHTGGAHRPG